MKKISLFLLASLFATAVAAVAAEEDITKAMDKAVLDYTERLRAASAELAATRERIAREKAPLLKAQREAEDRLLAAESELTRLQTTAEQSGNNRRKLVKETETLHKNGTYLNTLAQESLKAATDSQAPGEDQFLAAKFRELEASFADPAKVSGGRASVEVTTFLLERVKQSLGGYAAPGSSLIGEGNEVRTGTFAFVGPQTFFRSAQGETGVVVRLREGSTYPVTHVIKDWPADGAQAYFSGGAGGIAADATGGKALRLKLTTGTVWQHIQKGGYVAYAILVVGLLAVLLTLQKLYDLSCLAVDSQPVAHAFLAKVAQGGRAAAEPALGTLRATTREMFGVGLQNLDKSKIVLEEHLQALLLKQRLHFERWLPLLAVIATAAPLMGLLGTVVGMVKTFALITVFGTGNAAKLASGISEVLVATELGLAVAIPTLVVHGYLSQRIHKNLATLERYALEFVTAAQAQPAVAPKAEKPAA
ncbi:MAG TPA: MotA/TolQ/ExbB proton channel family protein [Lacunisphaera sp.]|nr:MotA/TolQ/ExbB proton channel family protein [Lacunisphaera sp.]